ncbi:MAG: hypothetical protein ACTHWF_13660 [Brachybacterium sp.]
MTRVIATVEQAAQWVRRQKVPEASWNPVYRALAGDAAPSAPDFPDAASLDLVRRQLTAPALLVVAVEDGQQTRRLRIGLDPAAVPVEQADAAQSSQWSEITVQEVPGRIIRLLAEAEVELAPAQLSIERSTDALRLTPAQSRTACAALTRGLPPQEVFAAIPDLDDALRDALTATAQRISLSLTLHDPSRRAIERPVTWSRLWVTGRNGLYRLDQPTNPSLAVHPVGGGDVLGTLLPILEQGLRFAGACAPSGGVR